MASEAMGRKSTGRFWRTIATDFIVVNFPASKGTMLLLFNLELYQHLGMIQELLRINNHEESLDEAEEAYKEVQLVQNTPERPSNEAQAPPKQ